MNSKRASRRRFLKNGAALASLTVGALRSASGQTPGPETPAAVPKGYQPYGQRSHFESSTRTTFHAEGTPPPGVAPFQSWPAVFNPLQDSVGIITPSSLHYVVSTGSVPPDIDPRQHRLLIHGMVDRPLIFTLEELKRLPFVTRIHFLECAGDGSPNVLLTNKGEGPIIQRVMGFTSCSEWTGVLLSLLLREAGVQTGAKWISAEGAETAKHAKSIPLDKAMDDVIVAYGQNGEAVRPDNGYPLRLLVPGWEGINNVKWLRRIQVMDQPPMHSRETNGYNSPRADGSKRWFQFQMGPKSIITFPSDAHRLPGPGFYQIKGLAWSGAGAVRRVEVSTDGGRTWNDAEFQGPVLPKAHSRFRLDWNWNGEETLIQSRCTDDQGVMQPTLAEFGKLRGVDVRVPPPNVSNHFNPIHSWKVARDGSVQYGLFS